MEERKMGVIFEALADQIEKLNTDIYLLKIQNEDLRKENAELKRQRDALCRRESEDGKL
jgi:FtsZ-binding cell division protein ZapB